VTISYRAPQQEDLIALNELGRTTFVETFGHLYSADNLERFLQESHSLEGLDRALNSDFIRYRVACTEAGTLIGYCAIGFKGSLPTESLGLEGRKLMELKQLYLRPSHFAQGISDALMEWALSEARKSNCDDVLLSVYSDNPRAQRFYQRYGFVHVGQFFFMVGDHKDDEFLYRLSLKP
jgi:diamine N-acetyltransferase